MHPGCNADTCKATLLKRNDALHFFVSHSRNIESRPVGQRGFDFDCYGRLTGSVLRPALDIAKKKRSSERNNMSAHSTQTSLYGTFPAMVFCEEYFFTIVARSFY